MPHSIADLRDVHAARLVLQDHLSPAPLIRSYPLERALGFSADRRVWIKDYGWTPVGSFKLMGALNWVSNHLAEIGDRPIAAHSSGNFASGIAYAGKRFHKRVIIVMPDSAPQIKFDRTRSLGAEIRTYDISRDHETGERDRLTAEITDREFGIQASPYDDNSVIAGNGVGGIEIVEELQRQRREISHFVCQVSGGGLMAGHVLPVAAAFPEAQLIGVEPEQADDFCQSLKAGERIRIDRPNSICDGLLSYDVGEHNWPILQRHVSDAVKVPDRLTLQAMKWLYQNHGLISEPSGAITIGALLGGKIQLDGAGDLVVVLSGRNVDEARFQKWINSDSKPG